jgi:hypothetical protein
MRLIQRNIAMQAAMQSVRERRPCDPSWSDAKRARKGCPPATPTTSTPVSELPAPRPAALPETTLATADAATGGQN